MEKSETITCLEKQPTSCDSAMGPRFTIKAIMFWTAVAAGTIPMAMAGADYPPSGVFLVGIYLTVVCGIATLVRFPRSLDAWIPIGIAALLVALFFTVGFLLPMVRFTDEFIHLLFFGGMPLGILFLVRNVIRMKRTGFSLTVFAYHSGVWLGWMGLTGAIIAAPIT